MYSNYTGSLQRNVTVIPTMKWIYCPCHLRKDIEWAWKIVCMTRLCMQRLKNVIVDLHSMYWERYTAIWKFVKEKSWTALSKFLITSNLQVKTLQKLKTSQRNVSSLVTTNCIIQGKQTYLFQDTIVIHWPINDNISLSSSKFLSIIVSKDNICAVSKSGNVWTKSKRGWGLQTKS